MFPDEASCAEHLAKTRWPEGFVCPRRKGREAWRIPSRTPLTFACKACRKENSVTSGTMMHRFRRVVGGIQRHAFGASRDPRIARGAIKPAQQRAGGDR
jgi:hypothetical protein